MGDVVEFPGPRGEHPGLRPDEIPNVVHGPRGVTFVREKPGPHDPPGTVVWRVIQPDLHKSGGGVDREWP